ncbi:hypothetical protein K440DRAFT_641882 [Wilcoxina mikolae CBS 423.85]|nr:hypothetical protein K440DRAFT_641882 [Wilcoxina mikolae CBS 423.85]
MEDADSVSYTPESVHEPEYDDMRDAASSQGGELTDSSPPQANLWKALLTELRPSYDRFLLENPDTAPRLHTLADILSHPDLSFAAICQKLPSTKDEEFMTEPMQLLYITLFTYHITYPTSSDLPSAISLLACAPKHGNPPYTSALRKAATYFLSHHSPAFITALFSKRSILSGSLEWFSTSFPNLDHLLQPEIQRTVHHISSAASALENAVSTMQGLEVRQLPAAESAISATKEMLAAMLKDVRNCLHLAEGVDTVAALRAMTYVLRAHQMFPSHDDEDDASAVMLRSREFSAPPAPVAIGREKRRLSGDDAEDMNKRAYSLDQGGRDLEQREEEEEVTYPPERGGREFTSGGSPHRGGYRGRYYDPNYRLRARGYRGGHRGRRGARYTGYRNGWNS